MKNIIIIIGFVVLFGFLVLLGCRTLISTISNSNDCERFNIDNIEVHTGIDIPAIITSTCKYEGGVKTASFVIDTTKVNIADYLVKNKLVQKDSFYFAQGETKSAKWNAQLDVSTSTLDMKIEFKEVK